MIGLKILTRPEQTRPEDGLHYVFGWRGADGPYYLAGDVTAPGAIAKAEAIDRGRWTRIIVQDVRGGGDVWRWDGDVSRGG